MAGQLTIDTLRAGSGVLATQNGMTGIAKAWVNYSGATQTINNSFNVSSVTYTSTGQYVINFTTAMPNANYCVQLCQQWGVQNFGQVQVFTTGLTSSALPVQFANYNGGSYTNPTAAYVAVFA